MPCGRSTRPDWREYRTVPRGSSASVLKYLKTKEVDGNRLVPRGYGEGQLRNRCASGVACSEREHQYNRRTEVKILELGEPSVSVNNNQAIAENSTKGTDPDTEPSGEPDAGKGGQEGSIGTEDGGGELVPVSNTGDYSRKTFTVVAGTFANKDNATRRYNLLNSLGYEQTTVVKQARSGLYAVYVNTFDGKSEAFSLVKKLANKQLSAYVLRQ